MFEEMTVAKILKDLRSIKVPEETREYLSEVQARFESKGVLSVDTQLRIRKIFNRYSKQVKELHAARDRARRTNGLRKMGLTKQDVERLAEQRREAIAAERSDVGF